jgi:hypothetical protein
MSPIALFAFKRPDLLRQTVEALQKNAEARESLLYVFIDGPRREDEKAKVDEVEAYCRAISGFKQVFIQRQSANRGLARSIIAGVSEVVNQHGQVIVVEDDLVTSPYFLRYMNEALEKYRHQEKIISIHGYVYPVQDTLPETFFLKGADCWGWATWARGWKYFEADGKKLLAELATRKLKKRFDFDGAYPYVKMLEDQIAGRNDSWAIRWNASAFLRDKLTLYPGRSLVHNSGFDSSGTHCADGTQFDVQLADRPLQLVDVPIEESAEAFAKIKKYLVSLSGPDSASLSFSRRFILKLKTLFSKL